MRIRQARKILNNVRTRRYNQRQIAAALYTIWHLTRGETTGKRMNGLVGRRAFRAMVVELGNLWKPL